MMGDRDEDTASVLGTLLPWVPSSSGGFFLMLQGVCDQASCWHCLSPLSVGVLSQEDAVW